jgi:hypothetical protein
MTKPSVPLRERRYVVPLILLTSLFLHSSHAIHHSLSGSAVRLLS